MIAAAVESTGASRIHFVMLIPPMIAAAVESNQSEGFTLGL